MVCQECDTREALPTCGFRLCARCRRQPEIWAEYSEKQGSEPPEPTRAVPGSKAKVWIMAARVNNGMVPHHPLDMPSSAAVSRFYRRIQRIEQADQTVRYAVAKVGTFDSSLEAVKFVHDLEDRERERSEMPINDPEFRRLGLLFPIAEWVNSVCGKKFKAVKQRRNEAKLKVA